MVKARKVTPECRIGVNRSGLLAKWNRYWSAMRAGDCMEYVHIHTYRAEILKGFLDSVKRTGQRHGGCTGE